MDTAALHSGRQANVEEKLGLYESKGCSRRRLTLQGLGEGRGWKERRMCLNAISQKKKDSTHRNILVPPISSQSWYAGSR